jgi:para-aminobenzoate synthetase/4-amino-4-deoxychorismate lyase
MVEAVFGSSSVRSRLLTLSFDHPLRTYSTSELAEVVSLLSAVEAAAKSGCWAALMLSYEAAPAFDRSLKTQPPGVLPVAWAAVFAGPSEIKSKLSGEGYRVSAWEPQVSRSEYGEAVSRIHELIARGHTYQVNYTFPLTATLAGEPLTWYRDLCSAQGADYCVYLDLGRYKVLSLSPELFFERKGDSIRTKPMKGTISRGRWASEDEEMAQRLATSAKDRAENVMIVDLLRNDLGKVSLPGSVQVSELFEVERFETLWQMTSTVESTLRAGVGLDELIAALFPCGSVTGAPKIRTMEIIRQLERYPRGVYTGMIGFIRPGGDCVFNVAIRTIVLDSETGRATFGVGGGITFDSTAEREYEECLLKSSFLNAPADSFQLLESLLLETGDFFLLHRHIDRLRASAKYFGFPFQEKQTLNKLAALAETHSQGRWKVRALLSKTGELHVNAVELCSGGDGPRLAALAGKPINSTHRFLFHKTTNRAVYDEALSRRPDCDDVILWNERGEITESTVANVVVSIEGQLYTPPLESGLLAGTFRAELIAQGKIRERVIEVGELRQTSDLFLINSVQKWTAAKLLT